jgi:hypothetical protein
MLIKTAIAMAIGWCCAVAVPAQGEQSPDGSAKAAAEASAAATAGTAEAKADRAIADYAATRDDPKRVAQRQRALQWLGEVPHQKVSEYLRAELVAAADTPFAAQVLQAIGRVPRPELHEDLWTVLLRQSATPVLRQAAAASIAKLGNPGIDRLLAFLQQESDAATAAARDPAAAALVEHGGERGLRGVAGLLSRGALAERLRLLGRLEAISGVAVITGARLKLVKDPELQVAAVAWRQLAVEGHAKAKDLAIDIFERLPEKPPPAVAAELIVGIALIRDPEFYPVLLRLGGNNTELVRRALRTAAPHVAQDAALVKYLATKGLEDTRPGARDAAIALLREAPAEAVQPLVAKVRAELANPKKRSLDLAAGLHELLAKDPGWRQDCLMLASAKETDARAVGLSLLLELGSDAAIVQAQQNLAAKAWELRSLAFRYLTRFRDVSSIPLLIARFDLEEGRLAAELSEALFVHTATRCWKRREWEQWWDKHKVGFALPHPDAVRIAGSGSSGKSVGNTASYHDIPLVSSRFAFVIDRSGSMSAVVGTDRKFTRLESAKLQLSQVVAGLAKTHHCNLILYDHTVQSVWERLKPCDETNKAELLAKVKQATPGGGTNIFDALERAFQDPAVDTIYLLTDGEPSAGRLVAVDDIADEVRRWNRHRQVIIHGISIGLDSRLLKRLTSESGGSYRYVK